MCCSRSLPIPSLAEVQNEAYHVSLPRTWPWTWRRRACQQFWDSRHIPNSSQIVHSHPCQKKTETKPIRYNDTLISTFRSRWCSHHIKNLLKILTPQHTWCFLLVTKTDNWPVISCTSWSAWYGFHPRIRMYSNNSEMISKRLINEPWKWKAPR